MKKAIVFCWFLLRNMVDLRTYYMFIVGSSVKNMGFTNYIIDVVK